MPYRIARSLETLRNQVDRHYPTRGKKNDGWIGDTSHSHRKSDHNPNENGVVQALDITNDPSSGLISRKLGEALIAANDPRLKYVISNRQIAEAKNKFAWHDYHGPSSHTEHVHISVADDEELYDDPRPWKINMPLAEKQIARQGEPEVVLPPQTLRLHDAGANVENLQKILNAKYGLRLTVDGRFGEQTREAVKEVQNEAKLFADGVVGPDTWASIQGSEPLPVPATPEVPPSPNPMVKPEEKKVVVADRVVNPTQGPPGEAVPADRKAIQQQPPAGAVKNTTESTSNAPSKAEVPPKQAEKGPTLLGGESGPGGSKSSKG